MIDGASNVIAKEVRKYICRNSKGFVPFKKFERLRESLEQVARSVRSLVRQQRRAFKAKSRKGMLFFA